MSRETGEREWKCLARRPVPGRLRPRPHEHHIGHAPDGAALAKIHHSGGTTPDFYYAPDTTPQPINFASLSLFGGNQAHSNLQPYLTISWCIAMAGIFPSRN